VAFEGPGGPDWRLFAPAGAAGAALWPPPPAARLLLLWPPAPAGGATGGEAAPDGARPLALPLFPEGSGYRECWMRQREP